MLAFGGAHQSSSQSREPPFLISWLLTLTDIADLGDTPGEPDVLAFIPGARSGVSLSVELDSAPLEGKVWAVVKANSDGGGLHGA